ncbi:uncharacterized protein isoform X1 [Danio rerio]|uniref:Uncharacterized protein isoform X1 n=2 Tax=Danio rerio TaxID=7955 RepID=A0AC58JUL8_DANRE
MGIKMFLESHGEPSVTAYACSCAAGKGLCNHLTALLYQTAHYVQLHLKSVPPTVACTSEQQRWHRPRTQGVSPEAVSQLVVQKPCSLGKTGVKSTLYKAHTGPLPDPHILASGAKLNQIDPKPLLAHILGGMSEMELVSSQFGPLPRGSPLSYHYPLTAADQPTVDFPNLPVCGSQFSTNLNFVPTHHQSFHLQSIQVSHILSGQIEHNTRLQSNCAAWAHARQPRVTASRFREVCYVVGESASQSLAARILKGTKQTSAMKRGLELEPEILKQYSETKRVTVLPCGFVVHPDAPHLGASPDGRVYDPSEIFPFGLVEVKATSAESIGQASFIKMQKGQAKLKETHKYYWQVQGQLAVTGLQWCDFVTDTQSDITIQRIWRDDVFITSMKEKLDMYYYYVYMDKYQSMV